MGPRIGVAHVFASFDYQWINEGPTEYLKHDGGEILRDYVKNAFDILKMDDYAKFDFRLDESGRYYFIDCNANPAFGPKEEGIAIGNITDMFGISFEDVLRRIIDNTVKEGSSNGNGYTNGNGNGNGNGNH
jgi:D-alanine-D-alanine ligase-like ATP-grasp enzyme